MAESSVLDTIREYEQPITLQRPGSYTLDTGIATPGADTPIPVRAAIFPMKKSARQLRNVPEGMNTLGWLNVWSLTELKHLDKFTWEAKVYTIQTVEPWEDGPFWRATAVNLTETAP